MSNPVFNALGGNGNDSILNQLNQLRSNPIQFLMRKRLNVPDNLSHDPQGIVQYLLNTGQMSQSVYNKLQNQVNQITRR